MQISKKLKQVLPVAMLFLAAPGAIAQSVSIDSITSPTMPSISSPTMGTGFYLPGNTQNPIYTGPSSQNQFQNQNKTNSTQNQSKETSSTSIASTLTASDLSTLDSLGLLTQVTGLLGTDTSSLGNINLSNLYTSGNTTQTNLILQQILAELESLKEQNNSLTTQLSALQNQSSTSSQYNYVPQTTQIQISENTPAATATSQSATTAAANTASTSSSAAQTSTATQQKANPHFLRFSVNGYNILSTCRSIYISQIQPNGSFLVTADRKYMSDGKTRTETFHILFKPNEASSGISSYSTATAVTQDYLNEYSFLYQLAQKGDLTASRTGNLVSLRTDDATWKLELLIDLGEE